MGPRETAAWPKNNPARRGQWLLGRMAAKLAVGGLLGWPLDEPKQWLKAAPKVEILPDGSSGAPVLWLDRSVSGPNRRKIHLSLSHTTPGDGLPLASALASVNDYPGLDLERHDRELSPRFMAYTFKPPERCLWPAGSFRTPLWVWCAKEAASKALRTGLVSYLRHFTLVELASDLAWAQIHCTPAGLDKMIRVNLFEGGGCLGAWVLEKNGPDTFESGGKAQAALRLSG